MSKKSIEQTYQKLSDVEHILHRPTMYIGTIEKCVSDRWIFSEDKMVKKTLNYSPGFYKIFVQRN